MTEILKMVLTKLFFIRPSFSNIRIPGRALNEEDLPPREGAQTRPFNLCQETVTGYLCIYHWLVESFIPSIIIHEALIININS